MQIPSTQTDAVISAHRSLQPALRIAREDGDGRHGGSLVRRAAAAVELPFSALFYWVD